MTEQILSGELAVGQPTPRGAIQKFIPQEAKVNGAKVDAIIEYAQRIRDWPLLERAVDEKIEQQREFVGWWEEKVQRPGQPKKNSRSTAGILCAQAEELTGITNQQVSKWRRWLKRETEYRAAIYGAAYKACMAQDANYRAEGTGQNEWYTPAKYVEAARTVMGSIDLDPASSEEAQEIIKATAYFTAESNGLVQEWRGNVWLNPPFSRDLIALFTTKLVSEYKAQRVTQAVLLTHNNTDTEWFHGLTRAASAICFTRGRIPFYRGEWVAAPPNGQAFFYLGSGGERFNEVFSAIGVVMVPHAQ